jgi:sugar phosphate permease
MSRRWAIFALASGNFFLSQFYRASNAVISTQLLQDLFLDTEGLGLLSASFFYAFALTQIPISIFLDRVGARRMMSALSLVGVLGALIFSWSNTLTVGVLGRALLGIGMACNLMGPLKLLTLWFGPLSFATLSGLVMSIGTVGNMMATTPLVLLVDEFGWRTTFQLIAGVNLLLIVVFYIVARDAPKGEGEKSSGPEAKEKSEGAVSRLLLLLKQRDYWIISSGTFVSYGVFAAFQSLWAGPYLLEVMGFSAIAAGNTIFLMNMGVIAGAPLWGALSDRLLKTRKWLVVAGHVVLGGIVLALGLLSRETGFGFLASLFFLFGFFRMTGALMYAQIKELMPLHMAGTAMTGINFFTMTGPAVFLQGLGALMQTLYPNASRGAEAFQVSFVVCAVCSFCMAALYVFTKERRWDWEANSH